VTELKKAAGHYATDHAKRPYPNLEFFEIEDAFLAGAAWQRERIKSLLLKELGSEEAIRTVGLWDILYSEREPS